MTITWMPQARASLQDIFEHIAQDDPEAALSLVDLVVDSVERTLSGHPMAGRPGRVEGTREWVAHRNYIVAYRMTDVGNVQVLNVMHSARLWPDSF